MAQPVSISYRLGRCEPIIRADNDPTECGGGPDDRMVKAEAKAGSAPIRDDRRWSGGAFTKIQPRASVECARRCSWPAFPHTCTLAYTHAYTAPTGPLHHTDRSTRGSHPRLCRSSSCVPILRASLVIRRAFSFSFPPASYSLSTLLSSGTVNGCADHEVPQEPARERRRGADGAIQWGRERRCIGRTMSVRSLLRTTCSEHALMLEAS